MSAPHKPWLAAESLNIWWRRCRDQVELARPAGASAQHHRSAYPLFQAASLTLRFVHPIAAQCAFQGRKVGS